MSNYNPECKNHGDGPIAPTPQSADWEHVMNPVRNQGQCGSCHTFATIAALEGASAVAGKKVSLSEEQLVDCMDKFYDLPAWEQNRPQEDDHPEFAVAGGCAGGDAQFDILHLMKVGLESQGGGPGWCACSRDSYPYLYSDKDHENGEKYRQPEQKCKEKQCHCSLEKDAIESCVVVMEKGFKSTQDALKNAVAQQPVAISIDASALSAWGSPGGPGYKKDVVLPDALSGGCEGTNHAVTAIGYGVDADGVEYFKIRNSWGDEWGNGGHFKVNVNANGKNGPLCMYSDRDGVLGMYPKLGSQPTPPTPSPPTPPTPTPPTPSPTPVPAPSPSPSTWCKGKSAGVQFECPAGTRCCGSQTLTPSCIDYTYNSCCEYNGVAVVCAQGQTCGHLAGVPACLPLTGIAV